MAKLLRIFFIACCLLATLGLAGHLVADAVCQSPDLAALRSCGTVPSRSTFEATSFIGLHAGFVLPTPTKFIWVLTLLLNSIVLGIICRAAVCPPLLHPPVALR